MTKPGRALASVLAFAGTAASSGWAATILPPPVTLAHCAVNSSVLDDAANCTLGSLDRASAALMLSPSVDLNANASSPVGPGIHGAAATAIVRYSFQVIGGSAGDIVPILIATQLNSAGSAPTLGVGFAALNVHTGAAGDSALAVCSDGSCGSTASSFSGTLRTRARSGDTGNEIGLQVEASVVGNATNSESASGSADPFIFIDPAFPGAGQYSIVVSPGVGNAAAVPEPATAELIVMAALMFAAARKR